MTGLAEDPIVNAIHGGMKRDITVALDNGCHRAGIILIYSGIDTMARLSMDAAKSSVDRSDFVRWADRYIRFPCAQQLTGLEIYAARCAVLHTYTTESELSRTGKARRVGYMDRAIPEIAFNPQVDPTFVLVSVRALRDAFFEGIDQFLVDSFADANRGALVESRLRALLHELPCDTSSSGEVAT